MNSTIILGTEASKALQCLAELQQLPQPELKGQNKAGGRYEYHKLEDLLEAMKPTLTKHECLLLTSVVDHSTRSEYCKVQRKAGEPALDKMTTWSETTLEMRIQSTYNINDYISIEIVGFKADMTSDKSLGSTTVARRYGILFLCNWGTSEVDDVDGPSNVASQLFGQSHMNNPNVSGDTKATNIFGGPMSNNQPASSNPVSSLFNS